MGWTAGVFDQLTPSLNLVTEFSNVRAKMAAYRGRCFLPDGRRHWGKLGRGSLNADTEAIYAWGPLLPFMRAYTQDTRSTRMDRTEIIQRGADQEADRIQFIEQSQGQAAAEAFARQTRALYRRAVVNRSAPAGDTLIRLKLLGSYCYLKQYLHRSARQRPD